MTDFQTRREFRNWKPTPAEAEVLQGHTPPFSARPENGQLFDYRKEAKVVIRPFAVLIVVALVVICFLVL